jgi:putative transposase
MADRIRQEGMIVNHKRVFRVYRAEGLQLPKRRRKRVRSEARQPLPPADDLNVRWSADFVSDALGEGRKFRVLNVVDDCSREDLESDVEFSIPGSRVREVLDSIAAVRGYPEVIVVDNGPEFRGREVDAWACQHGVKIHFIDPGKPMQNAFVESFNDKMRAECLNVNWFVDLDDAKRKIAAWRKEYNEIRPHSSIGRIPPAEFARRAAALRSPKAAPSGPQHDQTPIDRTGDVSVMSTPDQ